MSRLNLVVNRKESSYNFTFLLVWLILVMYFSNFAGMGDVFPLLSLPFIAYYVLKKDFHKSFMYTFIVLFLFCFAYVSIMLIYGYLSPMGAIGRLIYPTLFLWIGYFIVGQEIKYKSITNIFYTIIIALTAYGFFSLLKTILIYGSMNNVMNVLGGRNVIDLWSTGFISATALNAYLSFSLAMLPLVFIKDEKLNKSRKIVSLILFAVSFFSILQISSRTGLLIAVLSVVIITLFLGKSYIQKFSKLLMLLIFLIAFTILYNLNLFRIRSFTENTYLYERMISTNLQSDSRIQAWLLVLKNMFENPLGGKAIDLHVGYAHNLWLDVAYETGIFPFVLLIIFTISGVLALVKFFTTQHPALFKMLIASMCVVVFVIFMMEPILQGITLYFMLFCFLIGVIQKINFIKHKNKKYI